MKTWLFLLLWAAPMAMGFSPSIARKEAAGALFMTKKFPAGRPNTVQMDEDMAMWIEDKDGKVRKALTKPVGGRPATLLTKEQVEAIEKKGVSPFEGFKVWAEYMMKRPTKGWRW